MQPQEWLRQKKQLCVNSYPEADAKTSKRMAQDHRRKDIDKTSTRMAQDLELPRSMPEELPQMQRECRAASRSQCKGLLGRTSYTAQDIRGQDETNETRQCRTEITASDASNASDGFARHLAQPQRFDTRMAYGRQDKTEETNTTKQ